jgi:hypothetical protein
LENTWRVAIGVKPLRINLGLEKASIVFIGGPYEQIITDMTEKGYTLK